MALKSTGLFVDSSNLQVNIADSAKLLADSRQVKAGDIFICIQGLASDGHNYIPAVEKAGACLLIVSKPVKTSLPYITVNDSRKAMSVLATAMFGNPSLHMRLIGITGTNGKTSTTLLLAHVLRSAGYKTAVVGTLGWGMENTLTPLERTTPDVLELHGILRKCQAAGAEFVVMEVSSHAVALERIFGLRFELGAFLNLSRDHLDFHPDMEDYARTKFRFLKQVEQLGGKVLINIDDPWASRLFTELGNPSTFSLQQANFYLSRIQTGLAGTSFTLTNTNHFAEIRSPLIGMHNVQNLATAAILAHLAGLPWDRISAALQTAKLIPGRLERVAGSNIFVDYAHTPDGLEKVLTTIRPLTKGRLIVVVGAGGDRDHGKRPEMAAIATEHADLTIFTTDNPRNEDPLAILRDMTAGINADSCFWVEPDRRAAIALAVACLHEGDIVLLAGKGHETYQEIAGVKHPFDDRVAAETELQACRVYPQAAEGSPLVELWAPISGIWLEKVLNLPGGTMGNKRFRYVSTDTRYLQNDTLFFALVGLNTDGHKYLDKLVPYTGFAAIISNPDYAGPDRVIQEDTLAAWGEVARCYKRIFGVTTVAITGSYGKTTTKEYLSTILAPYGVLKTWGNENNLIGLPRTMFKLHAGHRFAVLELGTNQPGEIKKLGAICRPQAAILTAVDAAHLEHFGDVNGVFKEKVEVFRAPGIKMCFYPGDDPRFEGFSGRCLGVGTEEYNRFCLYDIHPGHGWSFKLNQHAFNLPLPAGFYVLNAAFAIACALELGIDYSTIVRELSNLPAIPLRMERVIKEGRTYIFDCYNANPASLNAALDHWYTEDPEKPHIAVLGDMLELGTLAEQYHTRVGDKLAQMDNITVYGVGPLAINYRPNRHFYHVDDFINSGIWSDLPAEAVVLIKASHGINLDKLAGRL